MKTQKTLAALAVLGILALPIKARAEENCMYKHVVDGNFEMDTMKLSDGREITKSKGTFAYGTIIYSEWVPNKEGKLEERTEILDWKGDGIFDNGYEYSYEKGYDNEKITDKVKGQKLLDKLRAYFDFI